MSCVNIFFSMLMFVCIESADEPLNFLIVHIFLDRNVVFKNHLTIVISVFSESQLLNGVLQFFFFLQPHLLIDMFDA